MIEDGVFVLSNPLSEQEYIKQLEKIKEAGFQVVEHIDKFWWNPAPNVNVQFSRKEKFVSVTISFENLSK